jgi:hypothetical protein
MIFLLIVAYTRPLLLSACYQTFKLPVVHAILPVLPVGFYKNRDALLMFEV